MVVVDYNQKVIFFYMCKGLLLLRLSTGYCFVIVVMVVVDYNQKVIFLLHV